MSFIHPEPPRIPPEAPRERHDDDQWRHDDGRRGRFPVSTTQILIGLLLLAVGAGLAAFLFGFSGDDGVEAAILGPDEGSVHPPGPVVVRIREPGGSTSTWSLAYRRVEEPDGWTVIAEGESAGGPRCVGRFECPASLPSSGRGTWLGFLQLDEMGEYEVRLVVSGGSDEVAEVVRFRVGE